MKKFFAMIFSLFFLLALVGCQKKAKTPVGIYWETDGYVSSYQIDDHIRLDGTYLEVTYDDQSTEIIPCTPDMIEGFDTSTTGAKTMYPVYKGLTGNEIDYTVYNPEGTSREIVTPTRIVVIKNVSEGKTTFDFFFQSADISVRALNFRMTGSIDFSDTLQELTALPVGSMNDYYMKKTAPNAVNILISGDNGQNAGVFFTLVWESETTANLTLSDIVVSDGKKDYYLPKVQ